VTPAAEEKRPAVQVNLAELLKQSGIVDDDESFFLDEEPAAPALPAPAPVAVAAVPAPVQQPLVESKEHNVSVYRV